MSRKIREIPRVSVAVRMDPEMKTRLDNTAAARKTSSNKIILAALDRDLDPLPAPRPARSKRSKAAPEAQAAE